MPRISHMPTIQPSTLILVIALSGAFALCGCFKDSHSHQEEESPLEDACLHMEQAGEVLTAGASRDEAPGIEKSHQHYRITLRQEAGSHAGWVAFHAQEEGEYRFFLGTATELEVQDAAGEAVSAETPETLGGECGSIAAYHTFHLEEGEYAVKIGPVGPSAISLVVIEGAHGNDTHVR